jgi:NADH dehydrogenase
MLPDCLGRGINLKNLAYDLGFLCKENNCNFIKDRVLAVDLINKQVRTVALGLSYDFLVIASGSETNFYGNAQIKERAYKLDDVGDASRIIEALKNKLYENYLIAGGGYTGIEVATNLRRYLKSRVSDKKVIIIERAPSILGALPEWMKDYVSDNLRELGVEVFTNSGVDSIENERVKLSDGRIFDNSMLIFAAGVRAADFIQDLKVEKNQQGRIKVDEYLRVNSSCFAIGDAGYVAHKNNFLRMAVQFAIMQGSCVGINIVRSIKGKGLVQYKPLDLGYIIPMANNKSCGVILGINMKGIVPTLMHYLMCVFRARSFRNRIGLLGDLIKFR